MTTFLILGYNKSLDQYTYADSDINDIIYECAGNTSFIGVTNDITFGEDGELEETIQIDRIQSK